MTFPSRLFRWYAGHGRDLPWRRTRDAYAVLVSEVMLQQTQVARVRPAYERFLARFPSLGSLARAPLGDALRAWSGLGYNRRARDLHRIARSVDALPRDVAELDALPGVGRYTAAAVACFAHGAAEPFADTNIRRVLGRVFLGRVASPAQAEALDARLMPRDRAAAWHHALMDLGALVCASRSPRCPACPVRDHCLSRERAAPAPRRRQPAFAASERRVRGRIVKALVSARRGMVLAALCRRVADPRVPRLVAALAAEGLVERRGSLVRLPE